MSTKKIAIFASGTGTNAQKIVSYCQTQENVEVALIVSNKPTAPVLTFAEESGIPTLLINRSSFYQSEDILKKFAAYSIDFVVLAGFLWLVPEYLITAYPRRIINIQPALLPKYGGKGMYGMNVHRAVKAAGEDETGITIHYVNKYYDEGAIIFQKSCSIATGDTPEVIAKKVQKLEHEFYPRIVVDLVKNLVALNN